MHTLKMKQEAVYKCIWNSTRLPAVSQIKILGPKDSILFAFNGWQLAKMKKSIPDMSLPWNL